MQTTVKVLLILIVATFVVANAGYAKKALAAVCNIYHLEEGCYLPPGTYHTKEPPQLTKTYCLRDTDILREGVIHNTPRLVEQMCNKLHFTNTPLGYPAETGGYQVK
jgi:hypothetical protein